MSELDKTFAMIESRFENLLFFDQMSPAELKKLNEMWRRSKPKRWDEFTEAEQKALAKEQAQLQRENKREQEWDSIRKFLQMGVDIKRDDPNSELYKTAKELQDIVDKAQAEPLSVSKYERRKFRTGLGRYKALLKAELKRQRKVKPAETEPDTTPAKEGVEKAKPTTSPAGLLNDLNFVLDDIERLEGSRRFNPYVDKYIRTELATAYHETKKAVEKIRAQNPAIKETPADLNDPREYLRNMHTWCVGQLFWENGERIGETPAETRQIGCPTSNITTKDIDKLLELFRQLENLLNPELPPRDGQLWFKAMEQSRKELADKLKKRQSGFTLRPSRNNLKRESIKARHPKKEEQAERIIGQMAEKKYRLWDSKYDQSLSQVEEKIFEVVKRIDHTLYSMKEPLLAFDRTQGTLLQVNFRNIRDDFTINEIRQFQDQDMVKKSIDALQAIRLKVERQQHLEAPIKNQVSPNKKNDKGSMLKMTVRSSKDNWEAIKSEYGISKRVFGKKINFVSDSFKRKIIFRDVEHAFVLASQGFSKPALILAGGVIEELLRQYLEYKKIKPKGKRFVDYIKACEDNDLLKRGVSRLTDSIRDFRNLVHLDNEKTKRHTVSKATAKGSVASIFTIANDFQKILSN